MTGINTILLNHFPDFRQDGFDLEKHYKIFKQNNVVINATTNAISYYEHWGSLSLKFTIKGREFYQVHNRSYTVEPDKFLLLNEGTLYSSHIHSKSEVESFTIHFCKHFVDLLLFSLIKDPSLNLDFSFDADGSFNATERLNKLNPTLKVLINQLYAITKMPRPNHPEIEEIYYKILYEICLQESIVRDEIKKVNAMKETTRKELYKRLYYAKDYIESCYNENIQLSTLAGITFMNEVYFLRQFKKLFQVTPRQYLIKKRIQVAASLLKNKEYSITEICHEVGYSDLTSFGKLFKQYYNTSPELFRRHKNCEI
eukprot:TRINITY_DN7521_c0_g1_i1.p1 TRINITY_DN7521_c0_g1~~TRINITY_DN7521_c0_g1_i1.p1  ORF type:complete len:313 (-),score=-38.61 TRINITY_DN7521_c0_g1_i1:844-1782(-)